MSKILKNTINSVIEIVDTGISIPALGQYTIPQQDYLIWAASDNAVTYIGSGDIIVNDGSSDLGISEGVDLIKGVFPSTIKIENTTGGTLIVEDSEALTVLNSIANGLGVSNSQTIFKKNEVTITSRNEFDLLNSTYTVPSGKKFYITSFCGSYDSQAAVYVRLKKQTGGSGSWETQFRLNIMSGGQGNSTINYNFGSGIVIGEAGDIFKITIESTIAKGSIYASFGGSEF